MLSVRPDQIDKIISRPNKIYNFCILAHVDHGKTTLCDHLLATNGIISKDLAGQIKYMDCLPAERLRNITMKTSAISLLYKLETPETKDLLYLTVVDSPGHVDFEAEVSNAVRLSDGCIILVDAVEGVSVQTELVLRVAFREGLSPILVINKVDRLFMELDMDPSSAELHLQQLLVEINAASGQENSPFDPSLGNVVFASCIEKWGVSVPDIAASWSKKLQKSEEECSKLFWGPHYYDRASRKLTVTPPSPNSLSFFAQGILMPIYQAHQQNCDLQNLNKILGFQNSSTNLNSFQGKVDLNPISLLSKWKPLSVVLLQTVIKFLETPAQAQKKQISKICPGLTLEAFPDLFKSVSEVDINGPMLAFVPKIVHGGILHFPPKEQRYRFVLYTRVYSGSIKIGDEIYVCHFSQNEKHSQKNAQNATKLTINSLYLFMGNELLPISRAPAGCVIGIGTDIPLLKQSTLCSEQHFPLFKSVTHFAQPIVRVCLEAVDLSKQGALQEGAELLGKIDPAVTISNDSSGQLVLSAMGEVHLQFCIDELKDYLAPGIDFSVSMPQVPCQETIISKSIPVTSELGKTSVTASAFSLPNSVIEIIKPINSINQLKPKKFEEIKLKLAQIPEMRDKVHLILEIQNCNILFADQQFASFFNTLIVGFKLCIASGPLCEEPMYGVGFIVEGVSIRQLTLAYLLKDDEETDFVPTKKDSPIQFGDAIGCSNNAFRQAFLAAQPRIREPMYRCEIQTDFSVVGKTYDGLQQHRCKITGERQKEGSQYIFISCFLPVIESFGFPADLRSRCSGKAHPQLQFSHFELIPDDPFWKPSTEEELEFYGKDGQELKPNVAKKIINEVRRRKGIFTENIEQKADKKATLSKTK